jgi:5,10-methylenetetrahydromethanopterin reductase
MSILSCGPPQAAGQQSPRQFCLDLSFYSSTPPGAVIHAAPLADKAGFDTLWLGEYYFYRDAASVLGYVAAQTRSIKLGSGTINIFTRHPALVAMTAATLDELSGGRFVLGIGYGGFPVMPLMGYGMSPPHQHKPLARLRTAVEVIRALLASQTVSSDDLHTLANVTLGFRPRRASIPVYIFSEGSATIAASPRFADGIVLAPGIKDPQTIEDRARRAHAAAQRCGAADFSVATFAYTLVTRDRREALQSIKRDPYFVYQIAEVVPPTAGMQALESAGMDAAAHAALTDAWRRFDLEEAAAQISDTVVDRFTICGPPDQCMDKINALRHLGFSRVGLNLSPAQDLDLLMSSLSPAAIAAST